jgi:predicted esterase
MSQLSFIHRFEPGTSGVTLLLLHGTGGTENDLVEVGRALAPTANLLSIRGKVLENGMPRFFRRLAEGVLDEADIHYQAQELADFLTTAAAHYEFNEQRIMAVGYSNGANIAAAILQLHPSALTGGILLRAMVPLQQPPVVDLTGKNVFIASGRQDPIIPVENAQRLTEILRGAGATVEHFWYGGGHELSSADFQAAQQWFAIQAD